MVGFETDRLKIRCIADKDIDALLRIYNSFENMRYISSGKSEWSRSELNEKYKKTNKNYKNGIGIFAVELKDSSEVIGEAGIFDSFNDAEKLELGYIIDSRFWRNGYGQETCKGLINYAFNNLKAKVLVARMYADNTNSVKLSESCQMRKVNEGIADNGKKYLVFELEK